MERLFWVKDAGGVRDFTGSPGDGEGPRASRLASANELKDIERAKKVGPCLFVFILVCIFVICFAAFACYLTGVEKKVPDVVGEGDGGFDNAEGDGGFDDAEYGDWM